MPPPSATAVAAQYEADVKSIGALRGSAKGRRNITKRLEAIGTLGILAGERCLDVGCATGDYTEEIARNFERVDAIDVERNRLDVFRQERRLRNVVVAEMSVYSMDFEDGTFDAVTLIEVLEHLERPADALAQVSRVLRPGGQLFITTPNRLWPFEQHGLKVRGKKRPGYMFPGLVWLSPLHRRVSDATAFRAREIETLGANAGLGGFTFTRIMPPMDVKGSPTLRRVFDWAERTPARVFGQTVIARMVKPQR